MDDAVMKRRSIQVGHLVNFASGYAAEELRKSSSSRTVVLPVEGLETQLDPLGQILVLSVTVDLYYTASWRIGLHRQHSRSPSRRRRSSALLLLPISWSSGDSHLS
jgi:hypothetical protein